MTNEALINATMQFMLRTQLRGEEALTFNACMMWLREMLAKPEPPATDEI